MALDEIAHDTLPSDDPSPEDSALHNESERVTREAVLQLPDKQRAALVMFYFNDLSIREVSTALGRPENTIKSDLRIARETLRRKLDGIVVSS